MDHSSTIVVTGAAGYVGSVVTSQLLLEGHSVVVLDSLAGGGESLLAYISHPRFRLVRGDVRDLGLLGQALNGAAAVVHLAAVVGEPACKPNEREAWSINLEGTQAVLEVAERLNVERLLYVSTCSNYGVSSPDALADEDAPLHPLGVYAQSKVEAERLVLSVDGRTSRSVLRLGTICGLSPSMRFDLLVNEMARAAVLGDPISIFAPAAWRPFLHIRDAARAIEWNLHAPVAAVGNRVFNVVGENYQKKQLGELVRRHFPDASIELTDKVPDARDYRVSGDRVRAQGFAPLLTVEDAFVEVAKAVRAGMFRDSRSAEYAAAPATTR
jgi:nucleoside-diphosphate-sugar epimerase